MDIGEKFEEIKAWIEENKTLVIAIVAGIALIIILWMFMKRRGVGGIGGGAPEVVRRELIY